jgi:hypothetical protein
MGSLVTLGRILSYFRTCHIIKELVRALYIPRNIWFSVITIFCTPLHHFPAASDCLRLPGNASHTSDRRYFGVRSSSLRL